MKSFICYGGLFRIKYLYADTPNYVADSIFYKHKIPVKYGEEFVKDGEPYLLVTCKIRRKYRKEFEESFEEVKNKMILLGHIDYEDWWKDLVTKMLEIDNECLG